MHTKKLNYRGKIANDMKIKLAIFKPEFNVIRDVMAVIENNGSHLVLTHPDELPKTETTWEIASSDVMDILPFSLTLYSSAREHRVNDSGADDDSNVEIYLVQNKRNNHQFDIVRRCLGRSDAVLTDRPLSLGKACNVLAACRAIDWQCLVSNSGDIETVCVSNAAAIIEAFEELSCQCN